ncbi:NAD(+) diphosphatase [Solirubrobacter deserti]|uniref:NAD(+) diphosphatase n=1 Tax=Solirubrobacter deserti TaxID=2282478 RepID=A0ABT4RHT5_9ACTN|nr:NAD(+) diphosphatase [Solirubrobacter deserti]MDA0137916.1 NAD(+) diphosphatase [Solirubrobacter deserti]
MLNAFTGAALDRAGDGRRRDDAWLAAQLEHPAARAVVAGDRGLRIADGAIELVPLAQLNGGTPLLLGLDASGPVFAYDEDPPRDGRVPMIGSGGVRGEPPKEASGDRVPLRQAAARLSREDGGLAAYTAALLNWHRRHRYCSACGHESDLVEGGLTRRCPNCGAEHHPRTDPVVIMLVTDGDRLLLGRQAAWPTGRYSALAGFVEPGESLEEAVAREVLEEAGVRVGRVDYISSQPWPFPASLMLGFSATYESGKPRIGDEELQDVRWFTRDEVETAAGEASNEDWTAGSPDGPLALPPKLAIARRLIENWLTP